MRQVDPASRELLAAFAHVNLELVVTQSRLCALLLALKTLVDQALHAA